MFDFLFAAPYESRCVGRDDFKWGFVSTASVNDGRMPYETAVKHRGYKDLNGKRTNMCIVESYPTKAAAAAGHVKWVKTMTASKPPKKLTDCNNAGIAGLASALAGENKFIFTYAPEKKADPL